MAGQDSRQWRGGTDGTPWMLRALVGSCRVLPLWFCYSGMALVVPFYMVFRRREYRCIYKYYRRTLGRGPVGAFLGTWLNHFRFGQVLIDRFAKFGGKRFRISVEGGELFDELAGGADGFVILSAHVGCFEMAGYSLVSDVKPINALVSAMEARTVEQNRGAQFDATNIRMIPVGDDLSHLYRINQALSDGEIVSMPADRFIGSGRSLQVDVLGREATLPAGPFTTVAQRDIPAIAVHVLRSGYGKYAVKVFPVYNPAQGEGLSRKEKLAMMAGAYAASIGRALEGRPSQWFNYLNFWND